MRYSVYTIFDVVQNSFQANLMLGFNDDDRKRNFKALVNSSGTIYNLYPTDFKLYKVATFDLSVGEVESIIPCVVATGLDVKDKE